MKPWCAGRPDGAAIVIENNATEDEATGALLHDAVEDQGGANTCEEIRQRFGENVAAIVDGLSNADQIPKPPWHVRKEAYIAHLSKASSSVLLVSLANKIDNAGSILRDLRNERRQRMVALQGQQGRLTVLLPLASGCLSRTKAISCAGGRARSGSE